MIKAPETMIFDLDGTLFQSETVLLPAYYAAFDQLKLEGLFEGETPDERLILGSLGMLLEHIWQKVLPGNSVAVHRRLDILLLQYQMEYLHKGVGSLYEGVAETLKQLHDQGVRLFVASNGLELYVKEVIEQNGLSHLFTALYSAGEYQTKSKVDLVKMLMQQHAVKEAWMVGDRSSDVEAGKANELVVVGCQYADFGDSQELMGADFRIKSFRELMFLPNEKNR